MEDHPPPLRLTSSPRGPRPLPRVRIVALQETRTKDAHQYVLEGLPIAVSTGRSVRLSQATGLEKIRELIKLQENPYWAKEAVPRYPFAPPIVCPAGYRHHSLSKTFDPTGSETREEASKQLKTLEYFRVYHLKDRKAQVGLWNGTKNFSIRDPSKRRGKSVRCLSLSSLSPK